MEETGVNKIFQDFDHALERLFQTTTGDSILLKKCCYYLLVTFLRAFFCLFSLSLITQVIFHFLLRIFAFFLMAVFYALSYFGSGSFSFLNRIILATGFFLENIYKSRNFHAYAFSSYFSLVLNFSVNFLMLGGDFLFSKMYFSLLNKGELTRENIEIRSEHTTANTMTDTMADKMADKMTTDNTTVDTEKNEKKSESNLNSKNVPTSIDKVLVYSLVSIFTVILSLELLNYFIPQPLFIAVLFSFLNLLCLQFMYSDLNSPERLNSSLKNDRFKIKITIFNLFKKIHDLIWENSERSSV